MIRLCRRFWGRFSVRDCSRVGPCGTEFRGPLDIEYENVAAATNPRSQFDELINSFDWIHLSRNLIASVFHSFCP
jgi:hypothetical protein